MDKSAEAFRTISEVAEILDTPAHVLRFWESRFPQIRPVKRAGGRRYYRPSDVALLTGIKYLLHAEGMTIRGVQKVLRDHGVRHVAGLIGADIGDIDQDAEAALSAALATNFGIEPEPTSPERAESATVVALETALRRNDIARRAAADTGRNVVETIDFAMSLETAPLGETPSFPGFEPELDLGLAPHRPAITTAAAATAALRALPQGSMPGAAALLARARALHAQMTQELAGSRD